MNINSSSVNPSNSLDFGQNKGSKSPIGLPLQNNSLSFTGGLDSLGKPRNGIQSQMIPLKSNNHPLIPPVRLDCIRQALPSLSPCEVTSSNVGLVKLGSDFVMDSAGTTQTLLSFRDQEFTNQQLNCLESQQLQQQYSYRQRPSQCGGFVYGGNGDYGARIGQNMKNSEGGSVTAMNNSRKYDTILENLGKKIENIAQIAKENELHEIEIRKYISHHEQDSLLTSPSSTLRTRQSDHPGDVPLITPDISPSQVPTATILLHSSKPEIEQRQQQSQGNQSRVESQQQQFPTSLPVERLNFNITPRLDPLTKIVAEQFKSDSLNQQQKIYSQFLKKHDDGSKIEPTMASINQFRDLSPMNTLASHRSEIGNSSISKLDLERLMSSMQQESQKCQEQMKVLITKQEQMQMELQFLRDQNSGLIARNSSLQRSLSQLSRHDSSHHIQTYPNISNPLARIDQDFGECNKENMMIASQQQQVSQQKSISQGGKQQQKRQLGSTSQQKNGNMNNRSGTQTKQNLNSQHAVSRGNKHNTSSQQQDTTEYFSQNTFVTEQFSPSENDTAAAEQFLAIQSDQPSKNVFASPFTISENSNAALLTTATTIPASSSQSTTMMTITTATKPPINGGIGFGSNKLSISNNSELNSISLVNNTTVLSSIPDSKVLVKDLVGTSAQFMQSQQQQIKGEFQRRVASCDTTGKDVQSQVQQLFSGQQQNNINKVSATKLIKSRITRARELEQQHDLKSLGLFTQQQQQSQQHHSVEHVMNNNSNSSLNKANFFGTSPNSYCPSTGISTPVPVPAGSVASAVIPPVAIAGSSMHSPVTLNYTSSNLQSLLGANSNKCYLNTRQISMVQPGIVHRKLASQTPSMRYGITAGELSMQLDRRHGNNSNINNNSNSSYQKYQQSHQQQQQSSIAACVNASMNGNGGDLQLQSHSQSHSSSMHSSNSSSHSKNKVRPSIGAGLNYCQMNRSTQQLGVQKQLFNQYSHAVSIGAGLNSVGGISTSTSMASLVPSRIQSAVGWSQDQLLKIKQSQVQQAVNRTPKHNQAKVSGSSVTPSSAGYMKQRTGPNDRAKSTIASHRTECTNKVNQDFQVSLEEAFDSGQPRPMRAVSNANTAKGVGSSMIGGQVVSWEDCLKKKFEGEISNEGMTRNGLAGGSSFGDDGMNLQYRSEYSNLNDQEDEEQYSQQTRNESCGNDSRKQSLNLYQVSQLYFQNS